MTPKEKIVGKNIYKIHYDGRIESRHRFLKPQSNGKGYFYVSLGYGTTGYSNFYIHRLVAEAFIPNPNNLPEVNHEDGDKANNAGWNLGWCTTKQNAIHLRDSGRGNYPPGKPIIQFTLKGIKIKEFINATAAAKEMKCTPENIMIAAKNPNKSTAKGYIWKYKSIS